MGALEIQHKLQLFLQNTSSFDSEMQVVYLMAEIRKLMEHTGESLQADYKSIKFYCDWTLHTEKTRSFSGLENVFEEIYSDCKNHIELAPQVIQARKLVEFVYFQHLRERMRLFFDEYGFNKRLLDDDDKWDSFIINLLNVLADQPIRNIPSDKITEICVVAVSDRAVRMRVVFKEPIFDRDGKAYGWYDAINIFH